MKQNESWKLIILFVWQIANKVTDTCILGSGQWPGELNIVHFQKTHVN